MLSLAWFKSHACHGCYCCSADWLHVAPCAHLWVLINREEPASFGPGGPGLGDGEMETHLGEMLDSRPHRPSATCV